MTDKKIDRRRMLTRLGLAAGAIYTAPALTSLGMARASGPSGASRASGPSRGSSGGSRSAGVSRPSRPAGGRSGASRPSRPSRRGSSPEEMPLWMRRMFQG